MKTMAGPFNPAAMRAMLVAFAAHPQLQRLRAEGDNCNLIDMHQVFESDDDDDLDVLELAVEQHWRRLWRVQRRGQKNCYDVDCSHGTIDLYKRNAEL